MFTIPKKSQQEIAREKASEINMTGQRGIIMLEDSHRQSFDLFWNSPDVSPQEICDILGSEAYRLFVNSQTTQKFISALRPDYVALEVPEGCKVTFNEDGTVTITDNRN